MAKNKINFKEELLMITPSNMTVFVKKILFELESLNNRISKLEGKVTKDFKVDSKPNITKKIK